MENCAATMKREREEDDSEAPPQSPSPPSAPTSPLPCNALHCVAEHGQPVVRLLANFPVAETWPHTIVKWYRENEELVPDDSKYCATFRREHGAVELAIRRIVLEDAGQYTVVASSPAGEAMLTARLQVSPESIIGATDQSDTHLMPSVLLLPMEDQKVTVGKRARFTVAACHPPEPRVYWFRDEHLLQASTDRFQIGQQGGVCTLDIAAIEPIDDNTNWKCEIVTAFGYAVTMAKLRAIVPKGYRRPEFLESLKATLTAQGTVSLECKVVGVPTPLLRWFKGDKEIRAGDMFNVGLRGEGGGGGGSDDGSDVNSLGVYTCVATNCMGKAISSAQVSVTDGLDCGLRPKLKVEEPKPVFVRGLENSTAKVGDNCRFYVRVRTPPPVRLEWYHEDELLEQTETGSAKVEKYRFTRVDEGSHCLDVLPLEVTDEGLWCCVATNQYGRATSQCNVTLIVPKNYREPEFVEDLVAIFTDDGLVSFECKVVGVPTPILRWYKDGLELKPGDIHQLSGTNSLGNYSCIARNCMGSASSVAELTIDDIQGAKERRKPAPKHPPRFAQHLKDQTVFVGQDFRFTVAVTCPPIPEVTWYKDNVRFEESSRHRLSREKNGVYNLDIGALEQSDHGVWKCLAVNDYGHSLTQCSLSVTYPKQYKKPMFIENLRAVLSEEGTVSLECKVVGVPQPVLKWYKDGVELRAGDIYKIVSGDSGTSSLGTYTCEASNCMGSASSTAALLAFDDKCLRDRFQNDDVYQRELSTITERDEFSTYNTVSTGGGGFGGGRGGGGISSTVNEPRYWDRAETEFSIYETPDITEDEARQIVEMFADEVSEYVSVRDAPSELPPLRFVKESAVVGNVLMEALIIDVPLEFVGGECRSRADDMSSRRFDNLATEADLADFSVYDPIVVDMPYDFSSTHELLVDISSAESGIVVRETSNYDTAAAAAAAMIGTKPEVRFGAAACSKRRVEIIEKPEVMIGAADYRAQFQSTGTSDKPEVEAACDQDSFSEDVTPSDNLCTDADVESIGSVEEEYDASAADDEDGRVHDARPESAAECTTPTCAYVSAMESPPPPPPPPPPLPRDGDVVAGSSSGGHNQPRMLIDISGAALQERRRKTKAGSEAAQKIESENVLHASSVNERSALENDEDCRAPDLHDGTVQVTENAKSTVETEKSEPRSFPVLNSDTKTELEAPSNEAAPEKPENAEQNADLCRTMQESPTGSDPVTNIESQDVREASSTEILETQELKNEKNDLEDADYGLQDVTRPRKPSEVLKSIESVLSQESLVDNVSPLRDESKPEVVSLLSREVSEPRLNTLVVEDTLVMETVISDMGRPEMMDDEVIGVASADELNEETMEVAPLNRADEEGAVAMETVEGEHATHMARLSVTPFDVVQLEQIASEDGATRALSIDTEMQGSQQSKNVQPEIEQDFQLSKEGDSLTDNAEDVNTENADAINLECAEIVNIQSAQVINIEQPDVVSFEKAQVINIESTANVNFISSEFVNIEEAERNAEVVHSESANFERAEVVRVEIIDNMNTGENDDCEEPTVVNFDLTPVDVNLEGATTNDESPRKSKGAEIASNDLNLDELQEEIQTNDDVNSDELQVINSEALPADDHLNLEDVVSEVPSEVHLDESLNIESEVDETKLIDAQAVDVVHSEDCQDGQLEAPNTSVVSSEEIQHGEQEMPRNVHLEGEQETTSGVESDKSEQSDLKEPIQKVEWERPEDVDMENLKEEESPNSDNVQPEKQKQDDGLKASNVDNLTRSLDACSALEITEVETPNRINLETLELSDEASTEDLDKFDTEEAEQALQHAIQDGVQVDLALSNKVEAQVSTDSEIGAESSGSLVSRETQLNDAKVSMETVQKQSPDESENASESVIRTKHEKANENDSTSRLAEKIAEQLVATCIIRALQDSNSRMSDRDEEVPSDAQVKRPKLVKTKSKQKLKQQLPRPKRLQVRRPSAAMTQYAMEMSQAWLHDVLSSIRDLLIELQTARIESEELIKTDGHLTANVEKPEKVNEPTESKEESAVLVASDCVEPSSDVVEDRTLIKCPDFPKSEGSKESRLLRRNSRKEKFRRSSRQKSEDNVSLKSQDSREGSSTGDLTDEGEEMSQPQPLVTDKDKPVVAEAVRQQKKAQRTTSGGDLARIHELDESNRRLSCPQVDSITGQAQSDNGSSGRSSALLPVIQDEASEETQQQQPDTNDEEQEPMSDNRLPSNGAIKKNEDAGANSGHSVENGLVEGPTATALSTQEQQHQRTLVADIVSVCDVVNCEVDEQSGFNNSEIVDSKSGNVTSMPEDSIKQQEASMEDGNGPRIDHSISSNELETKKNKINLDQNTEVAQSKQQSSQLELKEKQATLRTDDERTFSMLEKIDKSDMDRKSTAVETDISEQNLNSNIDIIQELQQKCSENIDQEPSVGSEIASEEKSDNDDQDNGALQAETNRNQRKLDTSADTLELRKRILPTAELCTEDSNETSTDEADIAENKQYLDSLCETLELEHGLSQIADEQKPSAEETLVVTKEENCSELQVGNNEQEINKSNRNSERGPEPLELQQGHSHGEQRSSMVTKQKSDIAHEINSNEDKNEISSNEDKNEMNSNQDKNEINLNQDKNEQKLYGNQEKLDENQQSVGLRTGSLELTQGPPLNVDKEPPAMEEKPVTEDIKNDKRNEIKLNKIDQNLDTVTDIKDAQQGLLQNVDKQDSSSEDKFLASEEKDIHKKSSTIELETNDSRQNLDTRNDIIELLAENFDQQQSSNGDKIASADEKIDIHKEISTNEVETKSIPSLDQNHASLDQNHANLDQNHANLNQNHANLDENQENLDENQENLDENQTNLDKNQRDFDENLRNLDENVQNLDEVGLTDAKNVDEQQPSNEDKFPISVEEYDIHNENQAETMKKQQDFVRNEQISNENEQNLDRGTDSLQLQQGLLANIENQQPSNENIRIDEEINTNELERKKNEPDLGAGADSAGIERGLLQAETRDEAKTKESDEKQSASNGSAEESSEMAKIKEELRRFNLDAVPKVGKMTIEELGSSFEDDSDTVVDRDVLIESAASSSASTNDDDDDDDVTLVAANGDEDEPAESLLDIEEIPLDDFTMENVFENMRTLRRLQTITEVDEITDDEQHVIATLDPSWAEDVDADAEDSTMSPPTTTTSTSSSKSRARSLQPRHLTDSQVEATHEADCGQRRRSDGDAAPTKRTPDSPLFIMKLRDMTIPIDYRMRLTCCVIGKPEPKVTWLKNGSALTSSMGYREISDFGICVLEIPRASPSDAGTFTCIARNDHGDDSTSGQLAVKGKARPKPVEPAFTRSMLNMRGQCGDSITMDCTVIGWPPPDVHWFKDSASLVLDSRMETKVTSSGGGGGTHRLVIRDAECKDSGVYRCIARNAHGRDDITAYVKIADKRTTHTSRFVRDSLLLPRRKSSTPTSSSSETTNAAQRADSVEPTSSFFASALTDTTVRLGCDVTLHCQLLLRTGELGDRSRRSEVKVSWFHNGRPLDRTSSEGSGHFRFGRTADGVRHTLTVLGASYSDLGMYTCRAADDVRGAAAYSSARLSFGLRGEDMEFGLAPVFIARPHSLNVTKDHPIVLACKVEGTPRPKVTWLKGARDMSLSRRAYKDSKGDIHKLIIHRAMNVDDGEYIVEARNKLGTEVVRCSVTVSKSSDDDEDSWDYQRTTSALQKIVGYTPYVHRKELPSGIGSEPRITDTGRNWATLSWQRPVNDGGSCVLAYRIEARESLDDGNGVWEEVGLSPITICDVYNLKADREYLFRVCARNMFGWGPPVESSRTLKIARRPDTPCFSSIPPALIRTDIGATIVIECTLSVCNPLPEIRWYKDGKHVTAPSFGRRRRITYDGTKATLTVSDVQEDEDDGCYVCEAISDGGRATATTVLQVQRQPDGTGSESPRNEIPGMMMARPPVISSRLEDSTFTVNRRATLRCQILGSPAPQVTWLKDGVQITDRNPEHDVDYRRSRIMRREGSIYTLEISGASPEDAGEYSIRARNQFGSVSCGCHLALVRDGDRASRDGRPPTILEPLENGSVIEGKSHTLRCTTNWQAALTVSWKCDGRALNHSRKYRILVLPDGTCTLTVVSMTSGDSGIYTCELANNSGTTSSSCAEVTVIQANDKDGCWTSTSPTLHSGYSKVPVFLTKPRSTEVLEYDSVELLCEVIGDPKPDVLWLRDGLKFDYERNEEHFRRLGDGPLYRLEISTVAIDDTGAYTIVARNCHGEAKAVVSLQVFARGQSGGLEDHRMSNRTDNTASAPAGNVATRPEVTRALGDRECTDGESVSLECRIESVPSPEIRWEKDGHVLRHGDDDDFRMERDSRTGTCRLDIVQVFPEDGGEYSCVAYTDAGTVATKARLSVQPRPRRGGDNNLADIRKRPVQVSGDAIRRSAIAAKRNVGPKFVTHPHNRVVDEGDTVKFTCCLSGHPNPVVRWEKCGRPISASSDGSGRVQTIDRDDVHSLAIADVTTRDAGTYTVTAANCVGKVFASAHLDVIGKRRGKLRTQMTTPSNPSSGPRALAGGRVFNVAAFEGPRILQHLTDRTIGPCDVGLSVSCQLVGRPRPTISWTVNGKAIPRSWSSRVRYDGRTASLDIASRVFRPNDQVRVLDVCCTAFNAHGTVRTCAQFGARKSARQLGVDGTVDGTVGQQTAAPRLTSEHRQRRPVNDDRRSMTTKPEQVGPENGISTTDNGGDHRTSDMSSCACTPRRPTEHKLTSTSSSGSSTSTVNDAEKKSTSRPLNGSSRVQSSITKDENRTNKTFRNSIKEECAQNKDGGASRRTPEVEGTTGQKPNHVPPQPREFQMSEDSQNLNSADGPTAAYADQDSASSVHEEEEGDNTVPIEDGSCFDDLYDVIGIELGKGRFGSVRLLTEKSSGDQYAGKFVRCIKARDKDKVKEEVDIMNRLGRHPKVLLLIAAYERCREMILVLEYIGGGELFERIVAEDFVPTERDCILFARQICDGVRYVHGRGVMHLDLKPENIMCVRRDGHRIKLIDFGLAKVYDPDCPVRAMFGTPEFVAPEVINYEPLSPASDMWSVGVVCYVMLSGLSPFMGENDAQTFANITKNAFDFDDEAFEDISQDALDFIVGLLVNRKEDRMSAQQCLEHRWINQHERTMSEARIGTEKLKRFLIRRRWQKTGNAILALGRIVSLTALSNASENRPRQRPPLHSASSGYLSDLSDSGGDTAVVASSNHTTASTCHSLEIQEPRRPDGRRETQVDGSTSRRGELVPSSMHHQFSNSDVLTTTSIERSASGCRPSPRRRHFSSDDPKTIQETSENEI